MNGTLVVVRRSMAMNTPCRCAFAVLAVPCQMLHAMLAELSGANVLRGAPVATLVSVHACGHVTLTLYSR